jgi:hypothetical protein
MECKICCEKSPTPLFDCDHCHEQCCLDCARRYFKEQTTAPACMSCRKVLTSGNLRAHFSASFVKTGMEAHRRAALLRADGAFDLMTMTNIMPMLDRLDGMFIILERERNNLAIMESKLRSARVSLFDARKREVKDPCNARAHRVEVNSIQGVVNDMAAEAQAQVRLLDETVNRINGFENVIKNANIHDGTANLTIVDDTVFNANANRIFKCTFTADNTATCNGLFKLINGKCLVCASVHCTKCMLLVPAADEDNEPHKCKPEDVANARFILSETKNCPRCHVGITRASGCDQMMCTGCNCVFNWSTGAEERGVIHNPHFFQLGEDVRARIIAERAERGLRANREQRFLAGVNPDHDLMCNEAAEFDPLCIDFGAATFLNAVSKLSTEPASKADYEEMYRIILHFEHAELTAANDEAVDDRFGEKGMRIQRLAQLRGKHIPKIKYEQESNGHGYVKFTYIILDSKPVLTKEAYSAQLMRIDTERTNALITLETVQTFVDSAKDMFRMLLACLPSDREGAFQSMVNMYVKTLFLMGKHSRAGTRKVYTSKAETVAANMLANAPGKQVLIEEPPPSVENRRRRREQAAFEELHELDWVPPVQHARRLE